MSSEDYVYTVILKRDGKELNRWVLSDGPLTIGRTRDNDVVIDDPSVSREHAILQRARDGYVIRDCGSRNGMNINGAVVESAALQDGDIIVLGDHRLFYQCRRAGQGAMQDFAAVESTFRGTQDDAAPQIENPAHLVMKMAWGEQTIVLDRPVVTIGSGPVADILVKGRSVAEYHADIVHSHGTYTLNHVDGRQKVLVDGKAVSQCALENGSTISIADSTLVFHVPVRADSE